MGGIYFVLNYVGSACMSDHLAGSMPKQQGSLLEMFERERRQAVREARQNKLNEKPKNKRMVKYATW